MYLFNICNTLLDNNVSYDYSYKCSVYNKSNDTILKCIMIQYDVSRSDIVSYYNIVSCYIIILIVSLHDVVSNIKLYHVKWYFHMK